MSNHIPLLLEIIEPYNFSDYTVYKLIEILYYRKCQGFDIIDFMHLLYEILDAGDPRERFSGADEFLAYFNGAIRNKLKINNQKEL